VLLGCTVWWR